MLTFPAGSGEKMQYLVHAFNDNTIRFVLFYPGQIDPVLMCRTAKSVAMGADILHASFHPGVLRSRWRMHEQLDDADVFTLRTAADPMQEAVAASLLPIAHKSRAQLHCTLVQGHSGCALAVRISHLCADGSDAKYLLGKLAEAYNLLCETGSCDGLHIKKGSRAPEKLYAALTPDERRSLMRNPSTGIKSPFPYPTQEMGEKRMAYRIIPADVMTAARMRAKSAGATANDLLLAACYAAYAACPGVDASAPLSVMSMMDLRRHCPGGDSEGLSNLSGALPTSLPEGMPADFDTLLAIITAQTQKEKNSPYAGLAGLPLIHKAVRTIPLRLLTRLAGGLYGSVGIGLTNLGSMDCSLLSLGGLKPSLGLFGGPLKIKPHMQVSAMSFDGACVLSVAGQYTQQDEQALLRLLDGMAEAVKAYACG